jgi:lipoate---protein ligase
VANRSSPQPLGPRGPEPQEAGGPRPRVGWLPPSQLEGTWPMAIDNWLLDDALAARATSTEADHPPGYLPALAGTLRFYQWPRPTLSLGFHQQRLPAHWLELAAEGVIDLVRRPSGGRAVLHGGDLTYALIWPTPPPQRSEAYRRACRWLQRGFAALDLPLEFGQAAPNRDRDSCFATSTAADLIHADGSKRIGSAQLWRRGALLQHGSILIQPQRALWGAIFGVDPPVLPDLPVTTAELITLLAAQAQIHLPQAETEQGVELVSVEGAAMPWDAIAAQRPAYQVLGASAP